VRPLTVGPKPPVLDVSGRWPGWNTYMSRGAVLALPLRSHYTPRVGDNLLTGPRTASPVITPDSYLRTDIRQPDPEDLERGRSSGRASPYPGVHAGVQPVLSRDTAETTAVASKVRSFHKAGRHLPEPTRRLSRTGGLFFCRGFNSQSAASIRGVARTSKGLKGRRRLRLSTGLQYSVPVALPMTQGFLVALLDSGDWLARRVETQGILQRAAGFGRTPLFYPPLMGSGGPIARTSGFPHAGARATIEPDPSFWMGFSRWTVRQTKRAAGFIPGGPGVAPAAGIKNRRLLFSSSQFSHPVLAAVVRASGNFRHRRTQGLAMVRGRTPTPWPPPTNFGNPSAKKPVRPAADLFWSESCRDRPPATAHLPH